MLLVLGLGVTMATVTASILTAMRRAEGAAAQSATGTPVDSAVCVEAVEREVHFWPSTGSAWLKKHNSTLRTAATNSGQPLRLARACSRCRPATSVTSASSLGTSGDLADHLRCNHGHHLIWYTLPYGKLDDYLQTIARLWRQGQHRGVVCHRLLAEKTIDSHVERILRLKGQDLADFMRAMLRS